MRFHPQAPSLSLALGHQKRHNGIGLAFFQISERHGKQVPGIGMKGGLRQLLFTHLTETFKAGNVELFRLDAVFFQLGKRAL